MYPRALLREGKTVVFSAILRSLSFRALKLLRQHTGFPRPQLAVSRIIQQSGHLFSRLILNDPFRLLPTVQL